ncbi:alcohol dehydrogenase family protein [Mesorhizobium sp.]|uniref:alcohol dehydrogenase family protein n=1 Tax=Mesorhizobium sp. TaxID=1871066 RepID=UPI00257E8BEF|nr:alcohol dehydrogenase family protein [Mesorhizobium sp.]
MAAVLPTHMKAVLLTGHGGPEKLQYRSDIPLPNVKADEVLIKVGAAGVNNTDIWAREGAYNTVLGSCQAVGWRGEPLAFPRIQGIDIAGRIVAVGSNIDKKRVGQRVLVDPVVRLPGDRLYGAGHFGSERDGGFAQFVAAPSESALEVESELSDTQLASFPSAYGTALHMLNRARQVAGEIVIVTGASGGVGTGLVQLAKLRGAEVLAIVGRGKEQEARRIGADYVVERDSADIGNDVRNALDGREADVLADVVGGAAFEVLLQNLRPEGGRYVTAGAIAGPKVTLDLRILYLRHLELIGSTIWTRNEFKELVDLVRSGKIVPQVARSYPLSEITKAQEAFKSKDFFGKLVLIPDD